MSSRLADASRRVAARSGEGVRPGGPAPDGISVNARGAPVFPDPRSPPTTVQGHPLTAGSNTSAARPSASATSPTMWPDAYSKPAIQTRLHPRF